MTDTEAPPDPLVIPFDGQMPEFEGRIPVAVLTSVTGTGQRIHRAIGHGERLIIVAEVEVKDVRHPMTDQGLKRVQVLKADDLYELPGKRGQRLLRMLREAHRLADDSRNGRTAIEGLEGSEGVELTADGSGVVLTDADRIDLGLDDPSLDSIALVFSTGDRRLWPDDFGANPPAKPTAGDYLEPPGRTAVDGEAAPYVAEVLDATTGETLDEFTEDDEEIRLHLAEQHAAVEEAAQDRAAAAELDEGRMRNRQPFDDYDRADVSLIKLWLDEDCPDAAGAEHVALYEEEHKGRKTVIAAARERGAVLYLEALD